MNFNMYYEDLQQPQKRGGKDSKMSKTTNPEAPKASRKYNKTRAEHYKDITIFVLVTAIIAFIAGLQFADSNNAKVQAAVQAVTPVVSAEPSK